MVQPAYVRCCFYKQQQRKRQQKKQLRAGDLITGVYRLQILACGKKYFWKKPTIIEVQKPMITLPTFLHSVKLRHQMSLRPRIRIVTGQSGTFQKNSHRKELIDYIIDDNNAKIVALLQNSAGEQCIDRLVKQLAELNATTKSLQRDDATACSTHVQLDTLLKNYLTVSDRFDADAQVIHDSPSEQAFSKIQEKAKGL